MGGNWGDVDGADPVGVRGQHPPGPPAPAPGLQDCAGVAGDHRPPAPGPQLPRAQPQGRGGPGPGRVVAAHAGSGAQAPSATAPQPQVRHLQREHSKGGPLGARRSWPPVGQGVPPVHRSSAIGGHEVRGVHVDLNGEVPRFTGGINGVVQVYCAASYVPSGPVVVI